MRDHGGDLDRARALYGRSDWIDLSTGINPVPYPMPVVPLSAMAALPTRQDISALEGVAARAYGTPAALVAVPGAQAAIQLVPRLRTEGQAAVLTPTYNEHAAAMSAQGWAVRQATALDDVMGADIAVVVNPNNPDGRYWAPDVLMTLADRVGLLVIDESFVDPQPDTSVAPYLKSQGERILVLRSFGKFYGLAGLRLGFAIGGPETVSALQVLAGPWAVSGPAIVAGRVALADQAWKSGTITRLARDVNRLDALAAAAGWDLVGGTSLFRTYETGNARSTQDYLARCGIWTRAFPYSAGWLRLGLPGSERAWARLHAALRPTRDSQ